MSVKNISDLPGITMIFDLDHHSGCGFLFVSFVDLLRNGPETSKITTVMFECTKPKLSHLNNACLG